MDWPTDWPEDVDPAALRQPDGVSCGPTTVVAARMLLQPGWRPAELRPEIHRVHRQLTSVRDATGRAQVPWPPWLGTPPWAVARVLTGLTGRRVRTYVARCRPEASYDELVARLVDRPAAVYVGSRWLPRHVVLALGSSGEGSAVQVFDPARGALLTVPAHRWRGHRVGLAGWTHLWAVV